jgi:heat shock protein HtpX
VTDGLLRGLTGRQLVGVLAHEVSHIRHNDMWIMSVADSVSRLVRMMSVFGQVLLLINLPMLLMDQVRISWLLIAVLILAPTASALLQLALSRNREFDADLEAAALTGDPQGLAAALERLERAQGSMWERIVFSGPRIPEPSLLRTHPSTEERVRRLLALSPASPPGGPIRSGPPFHPRDWPVVGRPPVRRWHGMWY